MNNIYTYNKGLVAPQDLGLYSGDIAITVPSIDSAPRIAWNGAPIDVDTFRLALAFLKWTYDEHKVEGQARFFYNMWTHEWRTVVLPQHIWSSAHTREVEENDPVKSKILEDLLNDGFEQAGTIHHHSTMGAFQSGGDATDEIGQAGFHVTVGRMTTKTADFHCRATFRKIQYDEKTGAMNPGDWLPGLSCETIHPLIAKHWLSLEDLPAFPEEWKALMWERPKTAPTYAGYQSYMGYQGNAGYQTGRSFSLVHDQRYKGVTPIFVDKMIKVWLCEPLTKKAEKQKEAFSRVLCHPNRAKKNFEDYAFTVEEAPAEETAKALPPPKTEEDPQIAEDALSDFIDAIPDNEFDQIRSLSNEDLKEYLYGLVTEGADTIQLATSDDDDDEDYFSKEESDAYETISDLLVDFHTQWVPEHMDANDIKQFYEMLESCTTKWVSDMRECSKLMNVIPNPCMDQEDLRELLVEWFKGFVDKVAMADRAEWDAYVKLSTDPQMQVSFYDLLLEGIDSLINMGFISDTEYNRDGTSARFVRA
jgi:hypothetical protein